MISRAPRPPVVPLDYRYALDAARSMLGPEAGVICGSRELEAATQERFPDCQRHQWSRGAVWIEPLEADWRSQIIRLSNLLPAGSTLVLIISRPLARIIPERRSWTSDAAGLRPRGMPKVLRHLQVAGFDMEATYGIHTVDAIGVSLLGRLTGAMGRPDWSDRLHFAARLRYCRDGQLSALATVGLVRLRRV